MQKLAIAKSIYFYRFLFWGCKTASAIPSVLSITFDETNKKIATWVK